jgi:hypothetical protein
LPVENAEITCNDYVLAAYDKICYMGKVLENNLSDRTYILEHVEDYVRDCITSGSSNTTSDIIFNVFKAVTIWLK